MKTTLVFGTFDGIHPGHDSFLAQARQLGDKLVVSVASDQFVRIIKQREPLLNEQGRLQAIKGHELVDDAIIGDRAIGNFESVQKVNPDTIALGYDQDQLADKLSEWIKKTGSKIKVVRLKPYKPEQYKSTKLRDRQA
ncbi:MAG: adenylyltransferase/cytidyltransferase family protein [Candidatus Uhrbacteria bacterium]